MTDQEKLTRIFITIDMLISDIDDPLKQPTKSTKILFDKLKDVQELLIPILDQFYSHKAVSMTNYYQIVQQKLNYIMDREFKKAFKTSLKTHTLN